MNADEYERLAALFHNQVEINQTIDIILRKMYALHVAAVADSPNMQLRGATEVLAELAELLGPIEAPTAPEGDKTDD